MVYDYSEDVDDVEVYNEDNDGDHDNDDDDHDNDGDDGYDNVCG